MSDKPETVAQWVEDQKPMWARADDLLGGTDAMRKAAEKYLPRFVDEPSENYQTRLKSTVLTNFYRSMARDIEGVMTAAKITVTDSKLDKAFLENVDRQGRDVHAFAAAQIFTLLTKGAFHILTDYPKNPGVTTLDEQQKAGLRPYWAAISPTAILDAITKNDAGVESITHVRWLERSHERDRFGRKTVDTIRILQVAEAAAGAKGDIEYVVYSRKNSDAFAISEGPTTLLAEKGGKLPEVTFVPVLADRRDNWSSMAPLDDVAYKAIEHWESSSDQRNILRVSRYPIMTQIGTAAAVKITGPGVTLHSIGRQAEGAQDVDFDYIEPTGVGIEAGERDLQRIQEEAEMIGVRLMAKPSQRTRADAESDAAKDQSPLQQIAKKLEDALTQALRHAAIWYGMEPEDGGKAVVPRDFGLSADDAKAIDALLKARAVGDLSQITLWAELRARGYLKTGFDEKEEQKRLAAEIDAMGMDGADPFNKKPKAGDEDDDGEGVEE